MCQIINSRPAGKGQTYGNIYLEVSESTTEEVWNRVYQESLGLWMPFPLQKGGRKRQKAMNIRRHTGRISTAMPGYGGREVMD